MKKCFTLLLLLAGALGLQRAEAQCGNRYRTAVFSNYDTSVVQYSSVYNLTMDVYEPTGDTASKRPLVILAHGGSFVSGDKNSDATVVDLCKNFAKRGYVAASINYRLAGGLFDLLDSLNAIDIVMKAVGDGKACVRYFRQDAAGANRFRIDPDFIYIGGNSAGAILSVHVAYITSIAEVPAHVATKINANGGIDGNSGNPGFCSNVNGVINFAGGINMKDWLTVGDPPIVSAHGDNDQTVPYLCGDVLRSTTGGAINVIDICGSGAMKPELDAKGIRNVLKTFPGDDHVPWQLSQAKFDFIDSMAAQFVFEQYCDAQFAYKNCFGVSVRENTADLTFRMLPNPARNMVKLETGLAEGFGTVNILDLNGRIMKSWNAAGALQPILNLEGLAPGIYVVNAQYRDAATSSTNKRLIVE